MSLLGGIENKNQSFGLFSKKGAQTTETTGSIASYDINADEKTNMKKKTDPLFNFGVKPPETTGEMANCSFTCVA